MHGASSHDGPVRHSSVDVSVVLPAYDEAGTLESSVETTLEILGSFLEAGTFEVLVAADGCTDPTPEIADRLATSLDPVGHVHSDERLGRGRALERAFDAARGDTLVYFDTDLATDMAHLEELVESVRSEGYDVATGSRWIPGEEVDRPAKQGIPSKGYNVLVRTLLCSDLRDHQCGFMAFDREALESLLADVEDDHQFWDTEVLVRAQRAGYDVKEFPVEWEPKGDSTVDLVQDVLGMGREIGHTFYQLSVRPHLSPYGSVLAGATLAVLALGMMTLYLHPSAVLSALTDAHLSLVAFAGVVYAVSWPLRGLRYRDILARLGFYEGTGFLTGAVFVSQMANLVVPARAGDLVRAYVVKARRDVPYSSGFASLAVERVFDLLTITALAVVAFLWQVSTGRAPALVSSLGGTGSGAGWTAMVVAGGVGLLSVVATGVIAITAASDRSIGHGLLRRIGSDRIVSAVERFVADVQQVAGSGSAFLTVGAVSVVVWCLDVLTAGLVLVAFDVAVPASTLLLVCVLAVSVGNLAKVIPISPGGVGLYEAAFTLFVVGLTPLGASVAFAAAIVDHALKNLVTVLGGAVSMTWLNVSLTTAMEESEAVDVPRGASRGQG